MPTAITIRDDAHWHDLRREHIGGSEVAVALGVSPYKTKYQLWAEKTRKIEPESFDGNERVEFGKLLEHVIAKTAAKRNSWKVRKARQYLSARPELPIGASVDYEISCPERGPGILECKATDAWEFAKWEDGEPPLSHLLQLQTYLMLTGRSWGAVAVLVGGNRLLVFPYESRSDTAGMIRDGAREFWECVDNDTPPLADFARDSAVIGKLYQSVTERKTVDLTDNPRARELASLYRAASVSEKTAEKLKEATGAELRMLIGDAQVAFVDGFRIKSSHVAPIPEQLVMPADVGKKLWSGRAGYRRLTVSDIWK